MTQKKSGDVLPVIFKLETNPRNVLAVFPTVPGTNSPYTCLCYAHFGQHASCDQTYAATLKPAKPNEYADLKRELEQIGYHLEVRSRFTRLDLDVRKAALRRE
jgi:hypothetical protein